MSRLPPGLERATAPTLIVLYPGPHPYPLAERIRVMPLVAFMLLADMLDRQPVCCAVKTTGMSVPHPSMNSLITGDG